MPRDAMAASLRSIGREPPALSAETRARAESLRSSGTFICSRTGRPGSQLPEPPLKGRLGQWIYDNIAAQTWSEWIGMGTKVINELRLDFSREQDQLVFDQHMCEYLGIDPATYEELTSQKLHS